jgi:glycosyltransferase involved in cell wall biosynthesis
MSVSAGNATSATAAAAGTHPAPRPIASVVIPAYNEQAVIGRTLEALLDGATGELDIVVVANACHDRTAEVAAEYDGVRVLSTPTGGKPHAIRLGDAVCETYPRIYLDADVTLSAASVRHLVAALDEPGVLAAAPLPEWDLEGAGRIARRVCKVHDALLSPVRALSGVGVYALTEQAHERVFPIPDVISDDGWVDRSFAGDERRTVPAARSVVRPARTVRAHLHRRVRVRLGNRELDALGKPAQHSSLRLRSLGGLIRARVVTPVDAVCYLGTLAADRVLTRRTDSESRSWSTDATTRS